jgi:hypothetical protein
VSAINLYLQIRAIFKVPVGELAPRCLYMLKTRSRNGKEREVCASRSLSTFSFCGGILINLLGCRNYNAPLVSTF